MSQWFNVAVSVQNHLYMFSPLKRLGQQFPICGMSTTRGMQTTCQWYELKDLLYDKNLRVVPKVELKKLLMVLKLVSF